MQRKRIAIRVCVRKLIPTPGLADAVCINPIPKPYHVYSNTIAIVLVRAVRSATRNNGGAERAGYRQPALEATGRASRARTRRLLPIVRR